MITGRIKIKKVDSDNNSCKAQGQATLVGAKYEILDWNNKVVDTVTIGNDCTATSKLLPYGNYKIKEKTSSTGYQIDSNTYTANINDTITVDITSKEKVYENFISILKQYESVDGETKFLNAEKGITFEIYYPNGKKFDEITTDKNGYATIKIPYGVWRFHQSNSTVGYGKIYDFYITVNETSEKQHYYNILNNSLNAYLQVLR